MASLQKKSDSWHLQFLYKKQRRTWVIGKVEDDEALAIKGKAAGMDIVDFLASDGNPPEQLPAPWKEMTFAEPSGFSMNGAGTPRSSSGNATGTCGRTSSSKRLSTYSVSSDICTVPARASDVGCGSRLKSRASGGTPSGEHVDGVAYLSRAISHWQQTFSLVARQFLVADDPGGAGASSAAFFRGSNTSEPAPLVDSNFRLAENLCYFLRGVPVLDRLFLGQRDDGGLDPFKPLDQLQEAIRLCRHDLAHLCLLAIPNPCV
jgi:hypothetical protein